MMKKMKKHLNESAECYRIQATSALTSPNGSGVTTYSVAGGLTTAGATGNKTASVTLLIFRGFILVTHWISKIVILYLLINEGQMVGNWFNLRALSW